MPILEQLLSKGYINGKYNVEYSNSQSVTCPVCNKDYQLEDGIYKCNVCNKYFRKLGLATYDAKKVSSSTVDYLIHLLTFCAKCDGEITHHERDFILEYIDSFDMNEDQLSFAYAQYDYARYNDYHKDTLLLLKKSICYLDDNKDLELEFLGELLHLILIHNRDISDNQKIIISDFLSIFDISNEDYENILSKVKNENSNYQINSDKQNQDLNQYYKILGLEKGCSQSELKKRYAYLTKSYHPDKYNSQDIPNEIKKELEDMYKYINFAYDKLKENI